MHAISTKLYEAAASAVADEQAEGGGAAAAAADGVVEADYEVIDET